MVKRLIGIVGSLVIVAIVAFAIMGRGGYSSAIKFGADSATEQAAADELATEGVDCVQDSVVVESPSQEAHSAGESDSLTTK